MKTPRDAPLTRNLLLIQNPEISEIDTWERQSSLMLAVDLHLLTCTADQLLAQGMHVQFFSEPSSSFIVQLSVRARIGSHSLNKLAERSTLSALRKMFLLL
jgi:hypothetical protein